MTRVRPVEFDGKQAITEILTALEYGNRKEETKVINPILKSHGLTRMRKGALADAIMRGPGFEVFFIDVLKAVRPFSLMLAEIYTFLNSNDTTAIRRASKFLVRFEEAKAKLEFDLQNFPRELLKTLNEAETFGSVLELRFPGIVVEDPRPQWNGTEAQRLWSAISPVWDNDFYDDGFHMALSYGPAILSNAHPRYYEEAEEIVGPIIDRLAAICEFVDALGFLPEPIDGTRVRSYLTGMTREPSELVIHDFPQRSYVVRDPEASAFFSQAAETTWNNSLRTVLDELAWEVRSFAISVNLWKKRNVMRVDRDDWLRKQLGQSVPDVSPEQYLHFIGRLASEYLKKLDLVAPVVADYSYETVIDRFLEFVALPFWKQRWYLYELWTLAYVLGIAQRQWRVELKGVQETSEGVLQWNLPGGSAAYPVATVGDEPEQILCWSQRKTYHPGTGAGLEPDLRFTRGVPGYHDILIIENKDRMAVRSQDMREALGRYVEGTCAESVWLINYEAFPESTKALEQQWLGRRVRIISKLRPGQVPQEFEREVASILGRHLPTTSDISELGALTEPQERNSLNSLESVSLNATLTWKALPKDLDLHTWIADTPECYHICYSQRGSLESEPYAELDKDDMEGNGKETVRMKREKFEQVVIAVHNYSQDALLSDSGAALTLTFDAQPTLNLVLHVPQVGAGTWWHAVLLDRSKNSVEVLQRLSDTPPVSP